MNPKKVATDQAEQNILDHVGQYGWSIMQIFDPEQKKPDFSFSIGMYETMRAPDIVIFGLERSTAKSVLNDIGQKVKEGLKIEIGKKYDLFFNEPCVCAFIEVESKFFREHLGSAVWYYDGIDFRAYQCVWSDEKGVLPWEEDFNAKFHFAQPLLGALK